MPEFDIRIRCFQWLNQQKEINGGFFNRKELEKGFINQDQRITLIGPQGIWKPAGFEMPISITSIIDGPYKDKISKDGYLEYKYQGKDPDQRANTSLRKAMESHTPLIYFQAIQKGVYLAVYPVYIVEDNPSNLTFKVEIDPVFILEGDIYSEGQFVNTNNKMNDPLIRQYINTTVQHRVHQGKFRELVLEAYNYSCCLCNLKHKELLDAAHIIPDKDPEGEPVVNNGLSLCKIHHAAFDQNILGITTDYEVKIRNDILEEKDGPMLKYGLQSLNGGILILPGREKDFPSKEFLSERFDEFKKAV